jgi:hypothetical protein
VQGNERYGDTRALEASAEVRKTLQWDRSDSTAFVRNRGRHGDDHPTFADAAQLLEDIAAVRRREAVRRVDDNSRRKVQNVRGDSSDLSDRGSVAYAGSTSTFVHVP